MAFESRLIPILREGVEVIKTILFSKMKASISEKFPERDRSFISKLAGAIINDLFGTPNREEPFLSFHRNHQALIKAEINNIERDHQEMQIPLTDALRIQFLCDAQEGVDSSRVLSQARDSGILIMDRDLPMPDHFMSLVRRLGEATKIIHEVRMGSA